VPEPAPERALAAWARLARCEGLTAAVLLPALARAGDVEALLAAPHAHLPPPLARELARARDSDLAASLAWLAAPGHALLPCVSAPYPALLRAIPDAPVALWLSGDATALAAAQVAIVGSRQPTPTGREIAAEWAHALAASGLIVTSGLAIGIDAAAHRGALAAGGRTIAVCATGLDLSYPRAHASLAAAIAAHGALVSEFAPGTEPRAGNFPRRNRILAALALGTLVVEAAERSGSLITARLAGEYGRVLFAIPGSIRNPLARGCHALLRRGARLVESPAEVLAALGQASPGAARAAAEYVQSDAPAGVPALDKAGEILLDALGFEPVDVDTLVTRTGFSAQTVSSMLLILELQGRVEPRAGRYCRAAAAPTMRA
jgi:DNA processing protein